MKKLVLTALCLLLALQMPAFAEPAGSITIKDFEQIMDTGLSTMQQYVDALQPSEYTWYYEGEATGVTYFTLTVKGGSLQLAVTDAADYQDDDAGLDGATELKGDVLAKEATLRGASWESDLMNYVLLPRGLQLGDSKQKVMETIPGLEEIDMQGSEEGFDGSLSCVLTVPEDPDEWHEYYGLDLFLKDGELELAQYWYSTDAE